MPTLNQTPITSAVAVQILTPETTHSYTPSDARAARPLGFDDVRAERAPRVRGVHEGLRGMLGVHVAHFRRMCLTARNSLRHPTSPITSRTGPTRFDAWSSRGGWPERTLGELPHVLGRHVVSWKEGHEAPLPADDVPAEHTRVTPRGLLGPPAPRGPRVEPRGARAGHNRALRGA